jgi:hypothetical protein
MAMRLLPIIGLALPAVLWSQTDNTSDLLNRLAQDSPFVPPSGAQSPGMPSTGQFEFRSVVVEDGRLYFSVYDSSRQRSDWVTIDETGGPFVARRYDESKDTLTIEVNGQTQTLGLKESRVHGTDNAPSGPPAPLPTNNAPTGGPTPGAPTEGKGPTPTNAPPGAPPVPVISNPQEAERLQNLANEIRRRRGLREMPAPQNPAPKN